jgi:hypothetical protein
VLTTGACGPAAGRLVRGTRVPLLRVASAAGVRAAGVLVAGVP